MSHTDLMTHLQAHYRSLCQADICSIDEQLSPDFVDETAPPNAPPGREFAILASTLIHAAFPDMTVTIDDIVVSGALVATRCTWRGTNTGPLPNLPATGRFIELTGLEMWRFDSHDRIAWRSSEITRRLLPRLLPRGAAPNPSAEVIRDFPSVLSHLEMWVLLNLPTDELTGLADKYGSDKGLQHANPHYYTYHYERVFRRWRWRQIVLLEIGLLNKTRQDATYGVRSFSETYSGLGRDRHDDAPSLRMWREYFPNARIVGIDIHDFSSVQIRNCQTYICDQRDRAGLHAVLEELGEPPNIIIDDGCHASEHQQMSFFTLFPRLAPGGIYVIEDLRWQPPGIGDPAAPTTLSCLQDFPGNLYRSPFYRESPSIEAQISTIEIRDTVARKNEIAFVFKR